MTTTQVELKTYLPFFCFYFIVNVVSHQFTTDERRVILAPYSRSEVIEYRAFSTFSAKV